MRVVSMIASAAFVLVAGFFFYSAGVSAMQIGQNQSEKPVAVAKGSTTPAAKPAVAAPAAAAPAAAAPAAAAPAAAAPAAAAPAAAAPAAAAPPAAAPAAAAPAAAAPAAAAPPVAVAAAKPAPAPAAAPAAAAPKAGAPKAAAPKLADDAGALNLKSDAPADVYVDGKKVGKTPLVGYRVNPGNYKVRFDCQTEGGKVQGTAKPVNVPPYSDVDVDHECSADKPAEQ
jgi:hypothetical protein